MNVFYQIRDQILLKGRERGEVRAGQADSGGHHNIDPPGQVTQDAIEVEGITHHLTLGLKHFFCDRYNGQLFFTSLSNLPRSWVLL